MGVQINGDTGNVIATKGTFSGDVGIGGTLTYEDVTNIDSVGLITARTGIEIGARPGVAASISVDGNMIVSGISTFGGDVQISSGGKLGIGTVTPGGLLHTHASSGSNRNLIEASAGNSFLRLKSGSTSNNSGVEFFSGSSNTANVSGLGAGGLQFEVGGSERLRIKSDGVIVSGNSGTSFGSAAIQSFIAHGSTAGESAFSAIDTTSVAAGVGGEIAFHGKYNTGAQDYAYTGHIRGIKENATAGDTACALTFHTRPNATAPIERMRISSDNEVLFGITATPSTTQNGIRIHTKPSDLPAFVVTS